MACNMAAGKPGGTTVTSAARLNSRTANQAGRRFIGTPTDMGYDADVAVVVNGKFTATAKWDEAGEALPLDPAPKP